MSNKTIVKRKVLGLSDKVSIITEIEGGKKQTDVAKDRNLSQSTVQAIWSKRTTKGNYQHFIGEI